MVGDSGTGSANPDCALLPSFLGEENAAVCLKGSPAGISYNFVRNAISGSALDNCSRTCIAEFSGSSLGTAPFWET